MRSIRSLRVRLSPLLLYPFGYVLLDWLSYQKPILEPGITPWSPHAGLSIALLVRAGPHWWPLASLAAFAGHWLVHSTSAGLGPITLASLWMGLSYGCLAALLRRFERSSSIDNAASAVRVAALFSLGTAVIAAGYIGLFVAAGKIAIDDVLRGAARYWVGELNGVLALAPLLLYWAEWKDSWRSLLPHAREMALQFLAVAATLTAIFMLPAADQLRFFYLLFVPIIWMAMRWSWPGAMIGVLMIQIGLLIAAETKIPTARFIDMQFLMLTLTLTALLLGAVVAERSGVLRRVALREAEQRALLAMAPDAVLALDAAGVIQNANAAAQRLFGARIDASRGVPLREVLPTLELIATEGRAELPGRRTDGTEFPAEIAWARLEDASSRAFLVTVRDVTERRRAEAQSREQDAVLARAMRLTVAGELASALAHELNQPITALVSYLRASQILLDKPDGKEQLLKPTLSKAAHEAIRASEVLRRLRDFYQAGAVKREPEHLNALCEGVAASFQDRIRRSDATLVSSVDPTVPVIEGDSTQIEIVIHNLIANAIDAVAQSPRPRAIQLSLRRDARFVTLCVEDSGAGVAPEVASRLFQPFTTSKSDGMGLGLAISRSLIQARGGDLAVSTSAALGGAAFTVRMPIAFPSDSALL